MRAGSTATASSSGTLGNTHPFTTKKGSSMDMASRPPAASRLLRAQGARALQISLCPPYPPRVAARASAWGVPKPLRAQGGVHRPAPGPALDGHCRPNPDSRAGPAAVPSPDSSRRVRPPGSAPGFLGLGQSRTPSAAPLPHPCTRDHSWPLPSLAGPGHLVTRPWRRGSGGGEGGRLFSPLAPQDSRPELLIPSQERHSGVLGMH